MTIIKAHKNGKRNLLSGTDDRELPTCKSAGDSQRHLMIRAFSGKLWTNFSKVIGEKFDKKI